MLINRCVNGLAKLIPFARPPLWVFKALRQVNIEDGGGPGGRHPHRVSLFVDTCEISPVTNKLLNADGLQMSIRCEMSLSNSNSKSEDTETCPKVIQKLSRTLCRPPTAVSATTDLRRRGLVQIETAHAHSRRAPWRTEISGLATTVKRPGTISLVPPVKGDGNLRPRAHGRRRRGSSPSCPR